MTVAEPIVETTLGTIRGRERGGVEQYLGIRFAQPPVGDLRFRAPQPVEPWDGVYDATRLGPCAPQTERAPGGPLPERTVVWDEDCLFLNVYTPAADDRRRPVLFWIHGGAFVRGAGANTDGTSFAMRGDLVVVTVNYRLGALGFMELGHLDAALAGSQNNGIRDQLLALNWVHDHIAAFGGDPDRVTICGNSAGAGSVLALLATPAADHLFHQAVTQSAPAVMDTADPTLAERMLRELGGRGLEDLRAADPERILEAQEVVSNGTGERRVVLPSRSRGGFRAAVDAHTVTRQPAEAVARPGAGKPLLLGTNADEGPLFSFALPRDITDDEMYAAVGEHTGDPAGVIAAYAAANPGVDNRRLMVDMLGDRLFLLPSLEVADAQARTGEAPVFTYLFTWKSEGFDGFMGAMHALEIPFVWNLGLQAWAAVVGGADPGDLAQRMHTAWIAFVRTGDPNHAGLPHWPAYDTDRRPTMEFGSTSVILDDPNAGTRTGWESM